MKPKRILFTIPNFDTAGSGKALLNIAKGLNSEEFEVHIMCLHNRGAFFKVVEDSGIPVHIFPFVSPLRPLGRLVKQSMTAAKQFKALAPDVIHSYNYSADYSEALAARIAGIPWVFTKKNMSWGGGSKNAWKLRSRLATKIAIQNTDMAREFYPKSAKTVLIPRGVDTEYFNPDAISKTASETKSERRQLICVANLVPVKGVETLIEAFSELHSSFPEWDLVIVGDDTNDYGQELHRLVESRKLSTRIEFTGKVSDVRTYLKQAEIFVLPTKNEGRREGSPVSLLEAMAMKKVVLGSDIPGVCDQLKPFPDYMFPASDVEQLRQKLSFFMSKPSDVLGKIGAGFRVYVKRDYPITKEIERHEALYRKLLKR